MSVGGKLVDVEVQCVQQCQQLLSGPVDCRQDSGNRVALDLELSVVPLEVTGRVGEHGGCRTGSHTSCGSDFHGGERIAFLRHGARSGEMRIKGLGRFPKIGALHVVEVLGDLGQNLCMDGQVAGELREGVSGCMPGDELAGEPEISGDLGGDRCAVRPHRSICACCTGELHEKATVPGLRHALTGSLEIGGPSGESHAESGGNSMLTIGACHHDGLRMPVGQQSRDFQKVIGAGIDEIERVTDLQVSSGVENVLGRGPEMDPSAGRLVKGLPKAVKSQGKGISCRPRKNTFHDGIRGLRLLGDSGSGALGDHSQLRLHAGQCCLDVVPALYR